MNHDTQRFRERLAAFRLMDDKRRATVCDAMRISQKTHLRLLAEIRKENGTLTKQERFREIVIVVRDWIGENDPKAISLIAGARALDISSHQVSRARDIVIRERLDATEKPKLALVPKPLPQPKRPKAERLFRVDGDRLFSLNREPMEVVACRR